MKTISADVLKRNIKSLRVRAGFTQDQAADKLLISKETIYRWEKEPEKMPIVKLAVLADLYHCTVNDFFAGI